MFNYDLINVNQFEYLKYHSTHSLWIIGLTCRSHVVHCHGDTSKRLYVKTGVPQGAVLGPLMFVLYINDISQSIVEAFINMFASLYIMGTNFKQVNDNWQNNVTNVYDWYTIN